MLLQSPIFVHLLLLRWDFAELLRPQHLKTANKPKVLLQSAHAVLLDILWPVLGRNYWRIEKSKSCMVDMADPQEPVLDHWTK